MSEIYIGLISGTSADGIDAVLVDLNQPSPKLMLHHYEKFAPKVRQAILTLYQPGLDEINRLGKLDVLLGNQFAAAANHLIQAAPSVKVRAIGSHGQTIRHYPALGFSLQIGDPNIIAAETGIPTVADFRRRDIALGGQGAPLVPAFHAAVFRDSKKDRAIVNIGGIANITLLPADPALPILGFDTGPGNALLDSWATKQIQQIQDEEGKWARTGAANAILLKKLLADPYFKQPLPKSTGREYFNLSWLENKISINLSPEDVQATLVDLTAQSILDAILSYLPNADIFICGGGVHNTFLMQRLKELAPKHIIHSTQFLEVDPDLIEAMAFAWLAQQTLHRKPGNLISVTGAQQPAILGGIWV